MADGKIVFVALIIIHSIAHSNVVLGDIISSPSAGSYTQVKASKEFVEAVLEADNNKDVPVAHDDGGAGGNALETESPSSSSAANNSNNNGGGGPSADAHVSGSGGGVGGGESDSSGEGGGGALTGGEIGAIVALCFGALFIVIVACVHWRHSVTSLLRKRSVVPPLRHDMDVVPKQGGDYNRRLVLVNDGSGHRGGQQQYNDHLFDVLQNPHVHGCQQQNQHVHVHHDGQQQNQHVHVHHDGQQQNQHVHVNDQQNVPFIDQSDVLPSDGDAHREQQQQNRHHIATVGHEVQQIDAKKYPGKLPPPPPGQQRRQHVPVVGQQHVRHDVRQQQQHGGDHLMTDNNQAQQYDSDCQAHHCQQRGDHQVQIHHPADRQHEQEESGHAQDNLRQRKKIHHTRQPSTCGVRAPAAAGGNVGGIQELFHQQCDVKPPTKPEKIQAAAGGGVNGGGVQQELFRHHHQQKGGDVKPLTFTPTEPEKIQEYPKIVSRGNDGGDDDARQRLHELEKLHEVPQIPVGDSPPRSEHISSLLGLRSRKSRNNQEVVTGGGGGGDDGGDDGTNQIFFY